MLTDNREVRKILREAELNGWVFVRGGKHIKGKHRSGKTATVSVTPQDGRALKNIRRDLLL